MPSMGKEIERRIDSPEAVAVREVENYIEKVEKSTETSGQDNQNNGSKPGAADVATKNLNQQASTFLAPVPKKIVLPLNEGNLTTGLRADSQSGIRWLAEWCVMIIKKYPGRVFYSPNSEYD
jgi:hypothetical protein